MWDPNKNPLPAGDPRKILRYALAVGAGLLVLWIFVLAQSDRRDSPTYTPDEQARVDSLRQALGKDVQPLSERDSGGLFTNAVTTFLILSATLLILWLYFRRKPGVQASETGFFKHIARQSLHGGQEIQVIEINDEYWVLACSPQQVNLLHRYKKEEWDLIVKDQTSEGGKGSFAGLLSNIQKRM